MRSAPAWCGRCFYRRRGSQPRKRAVLQGLLFAFALAGCSQQSDAAGPRFFNVNQFPGLVGDPGELAPALDYTLDSIDAEPLHFRSCADVAATDEDIVEPSQYSLVQLLRINCQAAELFAASQEASFSHFPAELTEAFIAELPATAVPRISDEELERRVGRPLVDYEGKLDITVQPGQALRVVTPRTEMTYQVMARADFTGDGAEDLLVRIDWQALDAFGGGADLLLLEHTEPAGPVRIGWRR